VVAARRELRAGPGQIARHTGVPVRTVSRILARRGVPPLAACDPLTGQQIRTHRASAVRYEHAAPGDLIHVDVKKLGKIPDGGGHRAHGRAEAVRGRGIGYDYVHAAVDDSSINPSTGWAATFSFANGQQISRSWNTTLTQTGAAVTACNVTYNGALAAGASTSFGFIATWNNATNAPPAVTCTLS
jgi:hypothetical protein